MTMEWHPDNGCECHISFEGCSDDGEFLDAKFIKVCSIHIDCSPNDVHNDNRRASLIRASIEAAGLDSSPERVKFQLEEGRGFIVHDRPGKDHQKMREIVAHPLCGARMANG